MANFQISITSPTTLQVDITDANDILTIVDHSNYDDASPEAGHSQTDFSDFRKMKLVLPNGNEYLLSSLYPADGDVTLAVPSGNTLPLSTSYSYTTGDGTYWIYLYAVPTYNAAANYLFSTTPTVYYDGSLWRALQDSTGQTPAEGAFWTEVTDIDNLSSKYRLAQRVVLYSDQKETWARRVYNSVILNNGVGVTVDQLLRDPEWLDAMKMYFNISGIPVLMKVDAWTEVDIVTNFGKTMKGKYEA